MLYIPRPFWNRYVGTIHAVPTAGQTLLAKSRTALPNFDGYTWLFFKLEDPLNLRTLLPSL
jgi:hypothetical protein